MYVLHLALLYLRHDTTQGRQIQQLLRQFPLVRAGGFFGLRVLFGMRYTVSY